MNNKCTLNNWKNGKNRQKEKYEGTIKWKCCDYNHILPFLIKNINNTSNKRKMICWTKINVTVPGLKKVNQQLNTVCSSMCLQVKLVWCYLGSNLHALLIHLKRRDSLEKTSVSFCLLKIYKHIMPSERHVSTWKAASQWKKRTPSVHIMQIRASQESNSVTVTFLSRGQQRTKCKEKKHTSTKQKQT